MAERDPPFPRRAAQPGQYSARARRGGVVGNLRLRRGGERLVLVGTGPTSPSTPTSSSTSSSGSISRTSTASSTSSRRPISRSRSACPAPTSVTPSRCACSHPTFPARLSATSTGSARGSSTSPSSRPRCSGRPDRPKTFLRLRHARLLPAARPEPAPGGDHHPLLLPHPARVTLHQAPSGAVATTFETSADGVLFTPAPAINLRAHWGRSLVVAVPRDLLRVEPGHEFAFFIQLLEGGLQRERYPSGGAIELTAPGRDFESEQWFV